jgi:hypothetical protein
MPTTLHLTENPAAISPEALLAILESGFSDMKALCEQLHCAPDDLAQALDDPDIDRLLHTKARLAMLQVKLAAINYLPHSVQRLQHIAETSDKPEVSRRATTTLINMAGIPTTAQHPPKSEIPPRPAPPRNSAASAKEWEENSIFAKALTLKVIYGLNLNKIPDDLYPAFTQSLQSFFLSHNLEIMGDYMDPPPLEDLEPSTPPPAA